MPKVSWVDFIVVHALAGCHTGGHFPSHMMLGGRPNPNAKRKNYRRLLRAHGLSNSVIKCALDKVTPFRTNQMYFASHSLSRGKRALMRVSLFRNVQTNLNDRGCPMFPKLCRAAKTCYKAKHGALVTTTTPATTTAKPLKRMNLRISSSFSISRGGVVFN